ncbi:hypothetical protein cyc_06886 [Cyclospora cayetanensis]|uniref:Uncharacterized protein n=1 Tax=Cyclospora cayetanensis TaxID=88456 RepID=A0A1D3D384_9EIME|nr:hypothetical protein cyc_06886 [Cyclospora cayetanensis]
MLLHEPPARPLKSSCPFLLTAVVVDAVPTPFLQEAPSSSLPTIPREAYKDAEMVFRVALVLLMLSLAPPPQLLRLPSCRRAMRMWLARCTRVGMSAMCVSSPFRSQLLSLLLPHVCKAEGVASAATAAAPYLTGH